MRGIFTALVCGACLVHCLFAEDACQRESRRTPRDEVSLMQVTTNVARHFPKNHVDLAAFLMAQPKCFAFQATSGSCYSGVPKKVANCSLEHCCSLAGTEGSHLFNYFKADSSCQVLASYAGSHECAGHSFISARKPEPSLYEKALLQKHRPPQQTAAQAKAIQKINAEAGKASPAAKQWVKDYMGSSAVRSRLDSSLHNYSNQDLLDVFSWEFQRLPIFHNGPSSAKDADLIGNRPTYIMDDTDLRMSFENGYLQNECTRFVIGGEEPLSDVKESIKIMTNRFGVPTLNGTASLRKANDCLLANSNNLRKTSTGTFSFGGFTYVLNAAALHDRLIWQAWDSGLTEYMYKNLTPPVYPGLGTRSNFLHLVQPHEEMWNLPQPSWLPSLGVTETCCNYSLAYLLNRWLVPGAPVPTAVTGGTIFMERAPYFEIATAGSLWLPEDLLYGIGQFRDDTGTFGKSPGIFGTPLADQLRDFCIRNKRPLVWASGVGGDGPMLIDPIVDNIAGGRITSNDTKLFTTWTDNTANGFQKLAATAPKHLHFEFQSYRLRHICAEAENESDKQVMGIDGEKNCVYWMRANPNGSSLWEVLNDGTCVQSLSDRAVHKSKKACLSANSKWTCVMNVSGAIYPDAHYCVPAPHGTFGTAEGCEASCGRNTAIPADMDATRSVAAEWGGKSGGNPKQMPCWIGLLILGYLGYLSFASVD